MTTSTTRETSQMARKTNKQMQALIKTHADLTRYWATKVTNSDGELVSDVYREGVLTGLNIMLETALHNAACYHGYRNVVHVRGTIEQGAIQGYVTSWLMPVAGQKLSSLQDATRNYYERT